LAASQAGGGAREGAGGTPFEAHPGDLDTVRRLLGHKSINTTLRAYANLSTKLAFQRYDETIANLRAESLKHAQTPRRRRA
jgi:hypothetical protein